MAYEFNLKNVFQDFNPSKFFVYCCLLVFCLLLALKFDGEIKCSYWIIFFPLWLWKGVTLCGCFVGCLVWIKNPHYRNERDSSNHFRAMIIATSLQMLLLMFELMSCDKLENDSKQDNLFTNTMQSVRVHETNSHINVFLTLLTISIATSCFMHPFINLLSISVISIGLCVWALKHGRSFEFEMFCSANILQFIFFSLRLDNFVHWRWVIIFIPIWILLCIALICVFYAIILTLILLRSSDIMAEQKRNNAVSAIGYTFIVTPLLVFNVLLTNKLDKIDNTPYLLVVIPLLASIIAMMVMSFNTRGANQWWFGFRKDFCSCLIDVCPIIQEYGNISYTRGQDIVQESDVHIASSNGNVKSKSFTVKNPIMYPDDAYKNSLKIISLDLPD